jgi:DNA-3-methyladenine glycosylase
VNVVTVRPTSLETFLAKRFAPEDFHRPTLTLARRLLGCWLIHRTATGLCGGRIVEVEAYLGPHDRGSHSYGGRMTERNRAMFGPKGHAYIYLIYGMYWCFNVVSGPIGKPQAILVRALEPVLGLDQMRENLGAAHASAHSLCRGPGKLCRALGITGELYGEPLWGDRLFLVPACRKRGEEIAASARINIAYAGPDATKPWRFFIRGNPCVSGPASLNRQNRLA